MIFYNRSADWDPDGRTDRLGPWRPDWGPDMQTWHLFLMISNAFYNDFFYDFFSVFYTDWGPDGSDRQTGAMGPRLGPRHTDFA